MQGLEGASFVHGDMTRFDHLDKKLWRWVDDDADSKASSAFTNAGRSYSLQSHIIKYPSFDVPSSLNSVRG